MATYDATIPENSQVSIGYLVEVLECYGATGIDPSVGSTLFKPEVNIRWGSCKKPIRKTADTLDRSSEWWKTDDGLCGMSVPSVAGGSINTIPNIGQYYDGEMNGWEYLLPRGVTENYREPYRVADFSGYYAVATPIVTGYSCPAAVSNVGSASPNVIIGVPIGEAGKQLQWSDFDRFKDCYLGVLIKGDGDAYFQTATATLGNGGSSIALQPTRLSEGVYMVYPVISTVESSTPSVSDLQGTFYTVPYASVTQLTVTGDTTSTNVWGRKETGGVVKMWFDVTNNSPSAVTLTNNYVYLRYKYNDINDELSSEERRVSIPSITVPAYSTISYTYEMNSNLIFSNIPTLLFNNCKVWITLHGGVYRNGVEPLYDIEIGDK